MTDDQRIRLALERIEVGHQRIRLALERIEVGLSAYDRHAKQQCLKEIRQILKGNLK